MSQEPFGRILAGSVDAFRNAYGRFEKQAVDWDLTAEAGPDYPAEQRTIARPMTVAGPGTFFGRATRTLRLEPYDGEGWWFSRDDLPDSLPIRVSIRNVWTTGDIVSNIVLRSGPPANYVRMVEHIIALRLGLGVDNLMIRLESGDPPLFTRGSLDLVETLEAGGLVGTGRPARFVTVKERVGICTPGGSFLIVEPCAGPPRITLDCAIDFPTAIGRQRLRYVLDHDRFKAGSVARTNTSFVKMLYCKTVGLLFADIRNLGYTRDNLLVASRWGYFNAPRLVHEGKALEACWHRSVLDLLAAVALIEEGRFAGHIISYRAGHALDCQLVRLLYRHGMLVPYPVA